MYVTHMPWVNIYRYVLLTKSFPSGRRDVLRPTSANVMKVHQHWAVVPVACVCVCVLTHFFLPYSSVLSLAPRYTIIGRGAKDRGNCVNI